MLLRSLSAASHSLASKPMLAEESFFSVLLLPSDFPDLLLEGGHAEVVHGCRYGILTGGC
ncbi:MAG: hypothetical protein Q8P42_08890 [Gallionella sp.]|nr:hypothetical protein [Gallionella sp.]